MGDLPGVVNKRAFGSLIAGQAALHSDLEQLWTQHNLAAAHAALDAAVATAYCWADCTPNMPDETILQRLLALNVERSQSNAKA